MNKQDEIRLQKRLVTLSKNVAENTARIERHFEIVIELTDEVLSLANLVQQLTTLNDGLIKKLSSDPVIH